MKGITRKQLMNNLAEDTENSQERRRFLQSGFVATIVSALGLSGFVGSASAQPTDVTIESMHEDLDAAFLEEEAASLLEKLADEEVIPEATSDVFPDHGLSSSEELGGVSVYHVREMNKVHRTAVRYFDDAKLTITVPENGLPYAVYTPADEGAAKTLFEPSVDGLESTTFGSGGFSTNSCGGEDCDFTDCVKSSHCWTSKRYMTEACFDGDCQLVKDCGC